MIQAQHVRKACFVSHYALFAQSNRAKNATKSKSIASPHGNRRQKQMIDADRKNRTKKGKSSGRGERGERDGRRRGRTLSTASMACARASSCACVRWLMRTGMTSARSRKERRCLSAIHFAASLCKPFRSLNGVEAYTWFGYSAVVRRFEVHGSRAAVTRRLLSFTRKARGGYTGVTRR